MNLLRTKWIMVGAVVATSAMAVSPRTKQTDYFSEKETNRIVSFWNDGRYKVVTPASAIKSGPVQVRLTPEGSVWLHSFFKLKSPNGKVNPSQIPAAKNPEQAAWDAWVDAKVNYDRYQAQLECVERNGGGDAGNEVYDPGPMPTSLAAVLPEPPLFASAVEPKGFEIKFPTGKTLKYEDNVVMRPNYAYYRFSDGVMSGGSSVKNMPPSELDRLFKKANIDPAIQRVLRAVSLLEGGFDSVNTYDTGYVSVGVIQFASLKAGAGSLGSVLKTLKENDPSEFQEYFRRYGIDVAETGHLVAISPTTGEELIGSNANSEIIKDKRLIAVFQHAGQLSEAFRVAQVQVAVNQYYPADETVTVKRTDGRTLTVKVSDVFRSEAGMATLMDRKVNTGKIDPLPTVINQVMNEYGLETIQDIALAESLIVQRMKYRKSYLDDLSLSQPRENPSLTSRGGSTKRGGVRPK